MYSSLLTHDTVVTRHKLPRDTEATCVTVGLSAGAHLSFLARRVKKLGQGTDEKMRAAASGAWPSNAEAHGAATYASASSRAANDTTPR